MILRTMQRLVAVIVVAGTLGVSVRAADVDDEKRRQEEVEQDRALLGVASGVDGAMGADLALKLLESGKLRSRALRREAVEFARFQLEDGAERFPLDCAEGLSESREAERYGGLALYAVDQLSLRCRLVRQMIESDRTGARDLLLELPPGLEMPETGCPDALMPRADVFYSTLGMVLERTLAGAERRQGLQWEIARRYVGAITTPGEIGPACLLVAAIGARGPELEVTANDLGGAISKMRASPRWILAMAARGRGGSEIAALLKKLQGSGQTQRRMRDAVRDLVVRSLLAPRCADMPKDTNDVVLQYFNETVFAARPITRDEVGAATRDVSAKRQRLYVSVKSRRMVLDLQNLNTARQELAPEADRTEWNRAFADYLSRLRSWNSTEESSDSDYVSQKTAMVAAVMQIAPDEETRVEAIRDFAVMLRHARTAGIPEYLALTHVSYVLGQAREPERKVALEMFRASGSQLLSAYATLQLEGVDVFGIGGSQTAP